MNERLVARGYVPGGGLLSPSGIFYLSIPKNASTYLGSLLVPHGWEHWNLEIDDPSRIVECIAVLRDPIDRWISGFSTYAASWLLTEGYGSDHFCGHYNELVERIIFDNIVFDDHTTEQSYFINQLPNCKRTYFKIGSSLKCDLRHYLGLPPGDTEGIQLNPSEGNYDTKVISTHMQHVLDQNPTLKAKIIKRYSDDYALITAAQFHYDPR